MAKKEELAVCGKCGEKYASLKKVEVVRKKIKDSKLAEILDICPECRKRRIMENFKRLGSPLRRPAEDAGGY